MYGAMLGDIIGAPYEFDRSPKRKDFPLFKKTMSSFNSSRYTDDSLMTVAVCEARLTAEVSHNHPEGVRGAEAVAAVIFLARNGVSKDEIKKYIIKTFASDDPKADNYNYNLQRSVADIKKGKTK